MGQMTQDEYYLQAAGRGDFTTVEAMVRQKEVDVDAEDTLGLTALIRAAERGDKQMTSYLLEMGADVNKASTGTGENPLLNATENAKTEVIELLLEKGADVNKGDLRGKTPLLEAVQQKNKWLTARFIKEGADINHQNKWGQTPLMRAVLNQDQELTTLLLQAGAKVNKQDEKGKTALHLAVENKNIDLVTSLVDAGADLEIKTKDGKTALETAFDVKEPELFEFLVRLGAKTQMSLPDGVASKVEKAFVQMPLYQMKAVLNEKIEIVKMAQETLFEAVKTNDVLRLDSCIGMPFIDLNRPDDKGQTALMMAAELSNKEVFETLIKNGADVKKEGSNGLTVKDILLQRVEKSGLSDELKGMIELVASASRVKVSRARFIRQMMTEKALERE